MKWKDMEEVGESGQNKQSEREAQLRKKKVWKFLNQSKKIFWSPTFVWFAGFRGALESLQLDSLQRPANPAEHQIARLGDQLD